MKPILGSPYRRGANNGIAMGLLLSAMFGCWSMSIYPTPAGAVNSLCALGLTVAVPLLLYVLLRRSYVADGGMSTFSGVWMEGIMTFICGGLIAVVVGWVYMRFISPGYLYDCYNRMYEALREASRITPGEAGQEYANMATNFKKMMERGDMPSIVELLFDLLWMVSFFGSILSLVVAAIVRSVRVAPRTS